MAFHITMSCNGHHSRLKGISKLSETTQVISCYSSISQKDLKQERSPNLTKKIRIVKSVYCLPSNFLSFKSFCKHLFIQKVQITMKETVENKNFPLFSILMKTLIYSQNTHTIFKVPLFSTLCSLSTTSETGTYGCVSQIPSFTHGFNMMSLKNIPRSSYTMYLQSAKFFLSF